MTIINDTRVVRLERTAARTGHQHSGDQDIREQVVNELVTAADVVSLPPGSLITLQRGPGAGLTEEGSVLNAAQNDIGGVVGGQTTSVVFDSEDGGATAATIFVTEVDFAVTLTSAGQYAINYKTFQIKTYTPVPTTPGTRILITYAWAPIREYLEWVPEDIEPDLEAFGDGPHKGGDFVEAGCGIEITENLDGYKTIAVDVTSLAGPGLAVQIGDDGCLQLTTTSGSAANLIEGCNINLADIDGYTSVSVDVTSLAGTGLIAVTGDDGCERLEIDFDGYLLQSIHIRKYGFEADNHPFNSVFSLDGYEYELGRDRLIVTVDGLMQFPPQDYVESSTTTIEFVEPVDDNEVIDILLLPGSLGNIVVDGSSDTVTVTLQNAYDDSPSGAKNITVDDGQITFTQTEASGSVLRLISNASVTTGLTVDQNGTGEAARLKSVVDSKATLLVQKDTTARNTEVDTIIIERTTSHVSGGLTGIGSGILTRLEDTGSGVFDASRITTGTESASDSAEKTYLAVELSDDGIMTEHMRLTSVGHLGIKTSAPDDFVVQVAGNVGPDLDNTYDLGSSDKRWKDGYFGPGSLHLGTGRLYLGDIDGEVYFERFDNAQFNLLDANRILGFEISDDGLQDGYVLTFDGNTGTLIFSDTSSGLAEIPDPYTPPDGTWNVVGKISVRAFGGGSNSEQFGENANAGGVNATAVGTNSNVGSTNGTAVGAFSSTNGGIALGSSATSLGTTAIAIGNSSNAGGSDSLALGRLASAGQTQSIAIGVSATSSVTGIAIGASSQNANTSAIVIGNSAAATSGGEGSSIVIGDSATIVGSNGVAIGRSTNVTGSLGAVAIGYGQTIAGYVPDRITIGRDINITAAATLATIIGKPTAQVTGANVTSVGNNINLGTGLSNITAVGQGASLTGNESVAVGAGSSASGANATAVGRFALSLAGGVAIGYNAQNLVGNGVAIGAGAVAKEQATCINAVNAEGNTIAIGRGSRSDGGGSITMGILSIVSGLRGIQIDSSANGRTLSGADTVLLGGTSANTSNSLSIGIGTNIVMGTGLTRITAVGQGATANATDTTVIGQGAIASGIGSIAIGQGASTDIFTNSLAIGQGAAVSANNQGVIGSTVTPMDLLAFGNLGVKVSPAISSFNFDVEVAGSIGPHADDAYSLGSPEYRWKDGYFGAGSLHVGSGRLFLDEDNSGEIYFERYDGSQFNLLDATRILNFDIDASNINNGYALVYNSADSTIGFNSVLTDPYTPPDGYFNIIGGISSRDSTGASSSEQFGENAVARGTNSLAVGYNATTGNSSNATAVGTNAQATQTGDQAFGFGAIASGGSSFAAGRNARATFGGACAIGDTSLATGQSSTAINQATATGLGGVAIGVNSSQTSGAGVAIGSSATSSGNAGIAIGQAAKAGTTNSIAIGNSPDLSSASATSSAVVGTLTGAVTAASVTSFGIGNNIGTAVASVTAVGASAVASATQATSLGASASASAAGATALGYSSNATGSSSIAIGDATATQADAVAIGRNAVSTGTNVSVAVGGGASATGTNATAIGSGANASQTDSIAIGAGAQASNASGGCTAVGVNALVSTGSQGTAVGFGARANGANNVCIGVNAVSRTDSPDATLVGGGSFINVAGASNATVIGALSSVLASGGTALGKSTSVGANGTNGTALGQGASVNGANSIAIGQGAIVTGSNSIAIGVGAFTSTFSNSFAIGSNALAPNSNLGVIGTATTPINVRIYGNVGIATPPEVQTFTLEVAGNIGPNIDDAYGLGDSTHRFSDGYYANDVYVYNKVRTGINQVYASLNVPILSADPMTFDDGDIWITDIADVKKLKVRIGGATYSTTLTLEV